MEYALGGNPTINDAATVGPQLSSDASWFYHVHNERVGDPNLSYELSLKGNLVSDPTWDTNGISEVGRSGLVDNFFNSVTNRTDLGNEEFIQLKIEKN